MPLDGLLALDSTTYANPKLPDGFPGSEPSYSAADLGRHKRLPDFGVFVSYRREDAALAAQWCAALVDQRLGDKLAFVAPRGISLGFDFHECIHDALHRADVMLAVIGGDWLNHRDSKGLRNIDSSSDWVRTELAVALDRKIPVIPIILDDAGVPSADELPVDLHSLARSQGYFVRTDRFEQDMNVVVSAVASHLGRA